MRKNPYPRVPFFFLILFFVISILPLKLALAIQFGLEVEFASQSFLETEPDARAALYERTKRIYALRSKVVHGDRLAEREEDAAITLADSYVPEAEQLVRRCIASVFATGFDRFFQSQSSKALGRFFHLLSLGYSRDAARDRC